MRVVQYPIIGVDRAMFIHLSTLVAYILNLNRSK